MKLSIGHIALASVLVSGSLGALVDGLRMQVGGGIQEVLQNIQDSATQNSLGGFSRERTAALMKELATELGVSASSIPTVAIDAWYEVIKADPSNIGPLVKQMTSELVSKAKKETAKLTSNSRKYPEGDWLHVASNDALPHYTLTAKNPEALAIDKVKQYSGYISQSEEDKHFFYWFFESRNDPKNDPIILWLNGGPGCSSLTGLFFELGPASIGKDIKPIHNPHSWNNNASVIFLDQPVNTGYSYSNGDDVSDTVSASKDVYAFLSLFFQQFPEYNEGHDFHIAGESYAGHYIPVIADEILSHPDRNFNLSSVLIGNGLTDPLRQYDYYEPMACGQGGEPSVLEPESCESMLDSQPRCDNLINACYSSQSAWTCVPATIYCNNAMFGPYQQTGRNVYDIRADCEPEGGSLCYTGLTYIEKYLNQEDVKAALGAKVDSYQGCNFDVNRNFMFKGDWMLPYYTSVVTLLESDLPVLIYAGDKDYICNWLGNEAWSRELEWSGSKGFQNADVKSWKTLNSKTKAGTVQNSDHFTFLRVFGAGHMVPYDQPEAALDMVNRWVSGDFSFA